MTPTFALALNFVCEWCGQPGLFSVHPGIVNDERIIAICTDCSNKNITNDVRGHYDKPVRLYETGIQRHWREQADRK